jgi:hypothetical protein
MKSGGHLTGELFLVLGDAEFPSPDVVRLADIIRKRTAERCRETRNGRSR